MKQFILYISVILLISSCVNKNPRSGSAISIRNEYASLFEITDSGDYYRLDIYSPWQGGDDVVITYYLSYDPAMFPEGIPGVRKIKLPVKSCVCLSTTHVAMINACGSAESIIGVSGTTYVSDSLIRSRISEGLVRDVGYDNNLNTELITSLNPEVVFVYGIGPESAGYLSKLEDVGIPVMYICDYLEVHPLAKAEWIKLFGLLFDAQQEAGQLFSEVSSEYILLRDSIQLFADSRPRIMLGLPYKDTWFVSPGNSYISQLIEDAGGEYIWRDYLSSESIPLGIESVFVEALESDTWLNIGNIITKADLLAFDRRFKSLPPVMNNRLYNNVLRYGEEGANDYWESGAIYPNIILKDIGSILHPEIIRDHELYYYLKVE